MNGARNTRNPCLFTPAAIGVLMAFAAAGATAAPAALDAKRIGEASGATPTASPDGEVKVARDDTPKVYRIPIVGEGKPAVLAGTFRAALDAQAAAKPS